MNDDISVQCNALSEFKKPSDYALFLDHDIKMVGESPLFHDALLNLISRFAQQSDDLDPNEKLALVSLIIQYMGTLLNANNLMSVASLQNVLGKTRALTDLLFKHELHLYLGLFKDTETKEALANISSNLLAIILMEPTHNRELVILFARLIVNLPPSAELWREPSLVRLCCSLMTNGQYTMMQVNKTLTPDQLKMLLIHVSQQQSAEEMGLDDESPIDEPGLALMSRYGITLIDKEAVQQQAKDIILRFSPSSSALPSLEPLHQSSTPRLNPLLQKLDEMVKSKENHAVLIHLLQLREKLLKIPTGMYDELRAGVNELLAYAGFMQPAQDSMMDVESPSFGSSLK